MIIIIIFLFFSQICASWNISIYMEASYSLHDAALKNLNDLASSGPNEEINFLVQLHAQGNYAWRYLIKKNKIIQIQKVELTEKTDQNIIDFFKWSANYKSAEKYAIILWDHGFGILNPKKNNDKWELEKQILECRRDHKGMLIDNYHNNVMNVKQLSNALKEISIFLNKKLDILGMDLCMGSMMEIVFEISEYAQCYVGSQNCELKDGWDYAKIAQDLKFDTKPEDFAKIIVDAYKKYYEINASGVFTISALKLEFINMVKKNLDRVCQEIIFLWNQEKILIEPLIESARNESLGFCLHQDYIDLINFLERMKFKFQNSFKDQFLKIINLIDATISDLQQFVIVNVAGKKIIQANGISIYAPSKYFDNSYLDCNFAKESLWISFLNLLNSHKI